MLLHTGAFYNANSGGGGSPGDPDFASVVLLAGFEGADGSTSFDDESSVNRTLTGAGNAQIDTAQFKFGSSSLLLDGTGDRVSAADSADWHLGTGLFTIEAFVRATAITSTRFILSQWGAAGSQAWALWTSAGALKWNVSTNGTDNLGDITGTGTLSTGQWYHVCIDYDGTKYRLYRDGTMVGSSSTGRNIFNSTAGLGIGAVADVGVSFPWNGWIDEVRITKGVARYASDGGFTVPTAAFPRS